MNKENIPKFLIDMLNKQYGEELSKKVIDGYSKKRLVTLRCNTLKTTAENIENVLNTANIKFERVPFYEDAFIIKDVDEAKIQELEEYKNGQIYIQSLSSMLPPIILNPKENEDILDMTAAPGGKTTQIAALTNNNAHITACEMNKIRLEKLKYNVEKQGASSVYIMNKDSRTIDDYFSFDKILLDSPCSGSGTLSINDFKLENNSKNNFTEKLIEKCMKSQEELLNKAIKILKPGHEMIYSTCSILSCENEEILQKVLEKENVSIVPIKNEFINDLPLLPTKLPGTICVMPTKEYEGFFIAKLVKNK